MWPKELERLFVSTYKFHEKIRKGIFLAKHKHVCATRRGTPHKKYIDNIYMAHNNQHTHIHFFY